MALSKEKTAELVATYGKDAKDTGSAEVQIAILTERIRELTDHLKGHKKDNGARRGLLILVGKRRSLLSHLQANDRNAYATLIAKLGIRK